MAFPTGDAATSAILVEKVAPAEVQVGAPLVYQIRVTNLTSLVLQNVLVTDHLPAGFRLTGTQPAAQNGGSGAASESLRWSLETMAPRAVRTIEVSGVATGPGVLTSCAEVTYNTSLCVSTKVIEPRLELVKTGPAEVLACDPIPYRFVVSNKGTGPARNVTVRDDLPEGLVTKDGLKSFALDMGTIPAGEAREATVAVQAQKAGTFTNKASATGEGGLKAESGTVSTHVTQPVLTLVKDGPKKVFAGRDITYSIIVTNTGDGIARDVILEDQVPAGLTVASATDGARQSGGKVQWLLGNLEPRGSKRVELTMRGGAIGTVRNSATAQAYCAKAVAAVAETEITGIAAVLLEVVDLADPIEVGGNETYVITVTNQGTATDSDIAITCTLDEGMQFVSGTGPTTATASGRTVTFVPLASLPAGTKVSWNVIVKAVTEGDKRFGVSMNTKQLTRSVDETEATNFYN